MCEKKKFIRSETLIIKIQIQNKTLVSFIFLCTKVNQPAQYKLFLGLKTNFFFLQSWIVSKTPNYSPVIYFMNNFCVKKKAHRKRERDFKKSNLKQKFNFVCFFNNVQNQPPETQQSCVSYGCYNFGLKFFK